jgi:hypothetical protein
MPPQRSRRGQRRREPSLAGRSLAVRVCVGEGPGVREQRGRFPARVAGGCLVRLHEKNRLGIIFAGFSERNLCKWMLVIFAFHIAESREKHYPFPSPVPLARRR